MRFRYNNNLATKACIYTIIALSFSLITNGGQENVYWNQFRGPNGQGVVEADRIPVHFSPESNVLWKNAIPEGHSSPVIWDNRIFLTASEPANKEQLITLAVDRQDGKILWRKVVQAETKVRFHPLNNPASSTPAVDDKHVYVYFGTYGLICYDHVSNVVWQRKIDTPKSKYGMATSPIAAGDKIIVASVKGVVTVIQADDKLNVLARNNFGDKIFATPTIAENKIYVRTTGHLYALGK